MEARADRARPPATEHSSAVRVAGAESVELLLRAGPSGPRGHATDGPNRPTAHREPVLRLAQAGHRVEHAEGLGEPQTDPASDAGDGPGNPVLPAQDDGDGSGPQ